jgi:hypothetical protein
MLFAAKRFDISDKKYTRTNKRKKGTVEKKTNSRSSNKTRRRRY